MKIIFAILIFVFAVVSATFLVVNSDLYQKHQRSKIMRPYLSGTNQDLFLKQVVTGEEPESATFEVPVKYDTLQNTQYLLLIIDPRTKEATSGIGNVYQDCKRADNGNCLLSWNTIFNSPGQHQLRARLFCPGPRTSIHWEFLGPIVPFVSSNRYQFSDPLYSDVILYATVAQADTNVAYTIEVTMPSGEHIKTITGNTTNGLINEAWHLNEQQRTVDYTNGYDVAFHIVSADGIVETNPFSKFHIKMWEQYERQ